MSKKINLTLFSLILLIFVLSNINAQSYYFNNAQSHATSVIESAIGILSPFLEAIIGDFTTSEFFFHKVLLLILLVVITKTILEKTPIAENNKKVSLILGLIVSILAIRFINEEGLFESVLIQYGVLGIAITTILPLVIFFYFIHNTKVGTYGRKMFWAIYVITLTIIWIFKSSEIPEVANWIYGLTITAGIIFIIFDRSIHSYFGMSHLKLFMKRENKEAIYKAQERIKIIHDRHTAGIISTWEWRKAIKEEEDRIRELTRE